MYACWKRDSKITQAIKQFGENLSSENVIDSNAKQTAKWKRKRELAFNWRYFRDVHKDDDDDQWEDETRGRAVAICKFVMMLQSVVRAIK